MRAGVAAVFVAVVLLAACTTQEFTPTSSATGRPAYDGQVAVLQKSGRRLRSVGNGNRHWTRLCDRTESA